MRQGKGQEEWLQLNKKEKELQLKLENIEDSRGQIEQIYRNFEEYDSLAQGIYSSYDDLSGSRYAEQLADTRWKNNQLLQAIYEELQAEIDRLKKEERQVEDDLDEVYYAKIRISHEEEEGKHGY